MTDPFVSVSVNTARAKKSTDNVADTNSEVRQTGKSNAKVILVLVESRDHCE